MFFDETAWVAVAFIIFFVLVWKKGKTALLSLLDERSSLIKKELNEAKSLKEIGKVIKYLKENSSPALDISLASKFIKEKLQNS